MSYSLRAEVRRTVLGFLLWPCLASGAQYLQSREATLALPELPQITFDSLLPPARAAIQDSYNTALARPRDASTNGKLGMVLHANNLLSEAQICYRRARSLDPGSLQWAYYLGLTQADLGNWGDAAATLPEAVRLNPEYLPAQLKLDRKSTRLNSSHGYISYAVFCLKKKKMLRYTNCMEVQPSAVRLTDELRRELNTVLATHDGKRKTFRHSKTIIEQLFRQSAHDST